MNSPWLRVLPLSLRRQLERRGYALRVVDNTAWVLAERLLRYLIGFLLGIWIARYLGVEQFGLLSYASAFVSVAAWLSVLGLDPTVVRELVADPRRRDEALGSLLALRLLGAALMLLVTLLVLPLVDPSDPRARAMILLISLAQVPMACDSIDCWFQAQLASRLAAIARILALLVVVAVRVILIWRQAPIEAFAWAILLEGVLVALAMLAAYRRAGNRPRQLRPSLAKMRALLANGWPLVLSTAAVAVYQRADQVMIGELAGYAAVGAYSVAVRFVDLLALGPTVLLATLYPALLIARSGDSALYARRVQALFDVSLWSALVLASLLWFAGGPMIRLFYGAAFAGAATVLAVLAWLPLLAFTGMVRLRVLMAENALRTALAIELTACALNIAGNLLLIPRWGASGAALAALAAAGIAPLVAAPFSPVVRRCNGALLLAVLAPLRYWPGHAARR